MKHERTPTHDNHTTITTRARDWLIAMYDDPWRRFLAEKRRPDQVWQIDGITIDAAEVVERGFTCDSQVCSPGLRARGKKSCCADLSAFVTERELAQLEPHFDDLRDTLAARGETLDATTLRDCVEEDSEYELVLKKRHKRCTFSWLDDQKILCGIHTMILEKNLSLTQFKPMTCQMFPLVMVPLGESGAVMTAIGASTKSVIGFGEAPSKFACLKGEVTTPLYQSMRTAIEAFCGEAFYAKLDARARQHLAALPPKPSP